jgi:hypothetical protein
VFIAFQTPACTVVHHKITGEEIVDWDVLAAEYAKWCVRKEGNGVRTTAFLRAGVVAGLPAGRFEVLGIWAGFFCGGEGKVGEKAEDLEFHLEWSEVRGGK